MTKISDPQIKESAREILGKTLGFRDCYPQTLVGLIAAGSVCRLGKGEALALRGKSFDFLGLIVQGSLETRIINPDGHRHLISFLQPGDVVGIVSVLDGLGHVNDLIARGTNTVILRMPGPVVREFRQSDPGLGRAFELQLAFRTRLLYERLAADSGMSMEARVARLLLILSSLYGEQRPGGLVLKIKVSQADLADWLGVSRQSVNTVLQPLIAKRTLLVSYSTFTIVDVEGLRQLAKL
jgi:CRP/FNR family transcriptional regulator, cyclic AMP receptor protein